MARHKRSEKLGTAAGVAERPVPRRKVSVPPLSPSESLQAFCPVCGRTITDRAVKVGGVTIGKTPYFEAINWDPDKPFGVALTVAGRDAGAVPKVELPIAI